MNHLLDAVKNAMQGQVFGAGFALMIAGAVMALARNLPVRLWNLVRRQVVVEVDVLSNDPLFAWLTIWLDQHPYTKRARRLSASTVSPHRAGIPCDEDGNPIGTPPVLFSPAPGEHLIWIAGRPVWLSRERREPSAGDKGGAVRETITLHAFGRSAAAVRGVLDEAHQMATKQERRVGVHTLDWGDWSRIHNAKPRALHSVVLPDGVMETILADAREFLTGEEWYNNRGIPWRRGYLFDGTPGTGKSSTVAALAGHLGLDLYLCNVSGNGMDDDRLIRSLLRVPERSIVLLEDVDCAVDGREVAEGKGGVTFSGLLNALDGVASRPGIITVLTTNHAEKLDPALLRKGRIDLRTTFGPADAEQLARLFLQFYGDSAQTADAAHFGKGMAGGTMADAQAVLLDHKTDPGGAVAAAVRRRIAAA